MNIAWVSWASCTRCMKEARMLAKAGHKLWYFGYAPLQLSKDIDPNDIFVHMSQFNSPQLLQNLLIGLDFIDLVHVHNEPSFPVVIAKIVGHKKVILDAHDLGVVRNGWENMSDTTRADLEAITQCDGLIVPCNKYIEILEERGKLSIPTLELLSYNNEEDYVTPKEEEYLGGIVYQGSIYAPAQSHPLPYRIYDNVAKEIISMNIPFYIYPAGGYVKYMPYYHSIGCKCMPSCDPASLLKNLSKHAWAFCGSPIEHRQWHLTLANKQFDYLSAGIPSIVYKADATAKFIKEHGGGVVIKDLKEIKDIYNDEKLRTECVSEIMKMRKNHTMESQLTKLEQFYEKVIAG